MIGSIRTINACSATGVVEQRDVACLNFGGEITDGSLEGNSVSVFHDIDAEPGFHQCRTNSPRIILRGAKRH